MAVEDVKKAHDDLQEKIKELECLAKIKDLVLSPDSVVAKILALANHYSTRSNLLLEIISNSNSSSSSNSTSSPQSPPPNSSPKMRSNSGSSSFSFSAIASDAKKTIVSKTSNLANGAKKGLSRFKIEMGLSSGVDDLLEELSQDFNDIDLVKLSNLADICSREDEKSDVRKKISALAVALLTCATAIQDHLEYEESLFSIAQAIGAAISNDKKDFNKAITLLMLTMDAFAPVPPSEEPEISLEKKESPKTAPKSLTKIVQNTHFRNLCAAMSDQCDAVFKESELVNNFCKLTEKFESKKVNVECATAALRNIEYAKKIEDLHVESDEIINSNDSLLQKIQKLKNDAIDKLDALKVKIGDHEKLNELCDAEIKSENSQLTTLLDNVKRKLTENSLNLQQTAEMLACIEKLNLDNDLAGELSQRLDTLIEEEVKTILLLGGNDPLELLDRLTQQAEALEKHENNIYYPNLRKELAQRQAENECLIVGKITTMGGAFSYHNDLNEFTVDESRSDEYVECEKTALSTIEAAICQKYETMIHSAIQSQSFEIFSFSQWVQEVDRYSEEVKAAFQLVAAQVLKQEEERMRSFSYDTKDDLTKRISLLEKMKTECQRVNATDLEALFSEKIQEYGEELSTLDQLDALIDKKLSKVTEHAVYSDETVQDLNRQKDNLQFKCSSLGLCTGFPSASGSFEEKLKERGNKKINQISDFIEDYKKRARDLLNQASQDLNAIRASILRADGVMTNQDATELNLVQEKLDRLSLNFLLQDVKTLKKSVSQDLEMLSQFNELIKQALPNTDIYSDKTVQDLNRQKAEITSYYDKFSFASESFKEELERCGREKIKQIDEFIDSYQSDAGILLKTTQEELIAVEKKIKSQPAITKENVDALSVIQEKLNRIKFDRLSGIIEREKERITTIYQENGQSIIGLINIQLENLKSSKCELGALSDIQTSLGNMRNCVTLMRDNYKISDDLKKADQSAGKALRLVGMLEEIRTFEQRDVQGQQALQDPDEKFKGITQRFEKFNSDSSLDQEITEAVKVSVEPIIKKIQTAQLKDFYGRLLARLSEKSWDNKGIYCFCDCFPGVNFTPDGIEKLRRVFGLTKTSRLGFFSARVSVDAILGQLSEKSVDEQYNQITDQLRQAQNVLISKGSRVSSEGNVRSKEEGLDFTTGTRRDTVTSSFYQAMHREISPKIVANDEEIKAMLAARLGS